VASILFCLAAQAPVEAAGVGPSPDAGTGGAKGGPGKTAPNPSIVYMSSSSYAPDKPAIRGVAFTVTGDTVSGSDAQLAKALQGRDRGSIVWSPDGSRYAWIEGQYGQMRKIMWARPGKAPTVLYQPSDVTDPFVWGGSDGLAWGSACSGGGSTLVFTRESKWDDAQQAYTEQTAIMAIDIAAPPPESDVAPSHDPPRLVRDVIYPNGFAFSPLGRHLAFNAGYGPGEKVSILPMCVQDPAPVTLLTWGDFGAPTYANACQNDYPQGGCYCNGNPAATCPSYPSPAVHSIDWSGDGHRLALSVTAGPDPDYPWRDLRIAYLVWNETLGTYAKGTVVPVNLDSEFGPASSEHSPQWGPSASDDDCERLAFSQSAGVSDGSTMNGRRLYLYDLVTSSTACLNGPRELAARDPRAIDWK
jgi:hypothetical protein